MLFKILIGSLIIIIMSIIFISFMKPTEYNFGNFSIEKKQLDNINDKVGNEFVLCNKDKGCVFISSIKNKEYAGPVRPTDDEEHFRKTGETISKEDKE